LNTGSAILKKGERTEISYLIFGFERFCPSWHYKGIIYCYTDYQIETKWLKMEINTFLIFYLDYYETIQIN